MQGTSLDDALEQVQKGDADAVLQQQGDTLLLTYSSADPVGAATVQGIFSAFVDQANIAVSGVPPTYDAADATRSRTNRCNRSSTSRPG